MSFLGLAGYYRKFIKNFSTIAKPLTESTKKDLPFEWSPDCETSFLKLKECLCTAPVLKYPNYTKTFTLTTDSSNVGLGANLSQNGHPVCYISRTLNSAEQNCTTTGKELLAIVWVIRRLRQYLLGRQFIIQTDHQALKWLVNVKDPLSRLVSWRLHLEGYTYVIEYKRGKDNTAADALSRIHPVNHHADRSQSAFVEVDNKIERNNPGSEEEITKNVYTNNTVHTVHTNKRAKNRLCTNRQNFFERL